LDSNEPGCAPSLFASVTNTAEPCSASTGQASPASTTFAPLTQTDWIGLDVSISSAADSLANPSPSPESKERRKTTATSGRKCAGLLHSRDPLGLLAKTLLASSRWHSTTCSLTWKPSATPRGRLLFRLVPSMRTIDETVCGSLVPTPRATDGSKGGRAREKDFGSLAAYVTRDGLLPTPTAQTYGTNQGGAMGRTGKARPSLETMARRGMFWATPTVKGDYNRAGLSAASGDGLATQVGGALNPTWVEWLMGFPEGWTALDASEMPLSRKSSKKSAEQSCSASS
jgi:hypothetical protein